MVTASPFPIDAIIGLDESTEEFTMLYSDARGVCRVVQMSLSEGVWKMWRETPGFFQHYTGTFSGDGNTITEPPRIPQDERLFIKWIPAKQFRVSPNAGNRLQSPAKR